MPRQYVPRMPLNESRTPDEALKSQLQALHVVPTLDANGGLIEVVVQCHAQCFGHPDMQRFRGLQPQCSDGCWFCRRLSNPTVRISMRQEMQLLVRMRV